MLIEWLIPDTPEFNFGKWTDMSMMAAVGGRERTRADFEKLFRQSGFELDDIVATASPTCAFAIFRSVAFAGMKSISS
jgi:hypothetical protein